MCCIRTRNQYYDSDLYITTLKVCTVHKNYVKRFAPILLEHAKIIVPFLFLKIYLHDFYEYVSKEMCLNQTCLSDSLLEMLKPHLAVVK